MSHLYFRRKFSISTTFFQFIGEVLCIVFFCNLYLFISLLSPILTFLDLFLLLTRHQKFVYFTMKNFFKDPAFGIIG